MKSVNGLVDEFIGYFATSKLWDSVGPDVSDVQSWDLNGSGMKLCRWCSLG